ncbi:hypothetical protein M501DRAFT_1018208 [Patellaria atrata CBS 101060]|uniref:Uncharacterized protein n=1 Tax=Patellaria atrata CBS 101060 TaxID=1346257 RepID=A0A9P4VPH4_9PEZI|nr:hypothetical protein M501DRAFT_1018208 [Patellaria atrata CBS 101060]
MPSLLTILNPPLLLLISIPLALFATLTTTLAFTTLFIRVSIVYFELGIALLHSWVCVSKPHSKPPNQKPFKSSRSRSHTPTATSSPPNTSHKRRPSSVVSTSSLSTLLPNNTNRDFEGVGGWRITSSSSEEEALWMGMNARLELPAERRHTRSLTGGSQRLSWPPETMRMSPVASRARTPNAGGNGSGNGEGSEGYFEMSRRRGSEESEESGSRETLKAEGLAESEDRGGNLW